MTISAHFDTRCAAIQALARTKDEDDVLDEADAYWGDGSMGDCARAIGAALGHGQQYPDGTPVWEFFLGETAVFFIGDEQSVLARIQAL